MSETKINASQTTITAEDIGASSAFDTMPTAAIGYLDKIVQYVGTTDATYTNGYFYKCVSDGQNPATYSWTAVQVQAGGGGSLPSQTGNAGKFLTTDGTDASWSDKPLINKATFWSSVALASSAGYGADSTSAVDVVAIGCNASAGANGAVAIGPGARVTAAHGIQISCYERAVYKTNNSSNTFKVANANGNFEIMSADGTVPTDRFTTTPSADGTYVPTLTISSGVATRSWTAPGGGGGSITTATVTLATADWSSNAQTVNVTGVTASNSVMLSPAPASQYLYAANGVTCSAQGAGTLTFSCETVPGSALTINVLIFG